MLENEKKHHLGKMIAIAFITFAIAFLAFYLALQAAFNKMTSPAYQARQIEKMIQHQENNIRKFEHNILMDNPFEPKMRPMLVNLVKESGEYKVIIDLKPLEGNENGIDVNIKDNIISVSGELDKKSVTGEKIINFSQSYYTDEKLETDKIIKEKKGDKYIITIPFED